MTKMVISDLILTGDSWDEWVTADRLMKTTEENIQKQKALDKKQGVDKNPKSGRSNQTKPKIYNGIPPFCQHITSCWPKIILSLLFFSVYRDKRLYVK